MLARSKKLRLDRDVPMNSEFVASFVEPMLFAFMSNVLTVIGVDRGQALQAMNNLEIGQKRFSLSEFKHLHGSLLPR